MKKTQLNYKFYQEGEKRGRGKCC